MYSCAPFSVGHCTTCPGGVTRFREVIISLGRYMCGLEEYARRSIPQRTHFFVTMKQLLDRSPSHGTRTTRHSDRWLIHFVFIKLSSNNWTWPAQNKHLGSVVLCSRTSFVGKTCQHEFLSNVERCTPTIEKWAVHGQGMSIQLMFAAGDERSPRVDASQLLELCRMQQSIVSYLLLQLLWLQRSQLLLANDCTRMFICLVFSVGCLLILRCHCWISSMIYYHFKNFAHLMMVNFGHTRETNILHNVDHQVKS